MNKTIIVLGMHRSGTSMIASVINRIGVNLGQDLLGKNPSNPFGHFEDREFLSLNKEIIQAAGGNWYLPPSREDIQVREDLYSDQISRLVAEKTQAAKGQPWGWKDPRTCLTLELFLPHIEHPYLIICYRSKEAIAESLNKRNGLDLEEGLELTEHYLTQIRQIKIDHPDLPVIELHYEAVVQAPDQAVRSVVSFLGFDLDQSQIEHAVNGIAQNKQLKIRKLTQRLVSVSMLPLRFYEWIKLKVYKK